MSQDTSDALDVMPNVRQNKKRKNEVEDIEEENIIEEIMQLNESDSESNSLNGHLSKLKQRKKKLKSEKVPCGNAGAEHCFKWLMSPVNKENFFVDSWEKEPVHVRRENPDYYKSLFTCTSFDKMMRKNVLEYGRNIDIVQYIEGERKTEELEGRAFAARVWDFFEEGFSVRMLNPQKYDEKIWQLCALLQEFFGSYVGVNMYLTPARSQGFAPHYDDIEAFVLQLEGRKQWQIYPPLSKDDTLPRESSRNFRQDEIGEPCWEFMLEPGDLLYFPRGFVHQAKTTNDIHSLHLTISTYQKNTWGDLLQLMLPQAIEIAMQENIEFRESLPKDYMDYVGSFTQVDSVSRDAFIGKLTTLTRKLAKYLPIDEAVDQHVKDFVHASLPPFLMQNERKYSIHGADLYWKDGELSRPLELTLQTKIRFIRKRGLRMISEEKGARLYYNLENGKDYKEFESRYVAVEDNAMAAVDMLINYHPEFVCIEDLPIDTEEDKLAFATDIYNCGLVMVEKFEPE